jgi:hypothetical protein
MLLGAVINHAMTRIEAWVQTRSEARRANPRSSARS